MVPGAVAEAAMEETMPDAGAYRHIALFDAPGPLGGEVRCGDVRDADDGTIAEIRRAWLDRKVVVMRGQTLTDAELVAFGARFGEFQYSNPLSNPLVVAGKVARQGGGPAEHPEITVVSNVVENGVALGGLGDGEVVWHTDMSSFDAPPNQTILFALEVPPDGGATSFCDMERALDTLPEDLRRAVDGLDLKHDAMIDAAGFVRPEYAHLVDAEPEETPGAIHPLIRTHPETGRDSLYLGRRSNARLIGFARKRSDAVLARLWRHATGAANIWRHWWKPGDVVMWDNRCVMHRREPFDPTSRRVMHRVVIKGTPPRRVRGNAAAETRQIAS
jgi:taurine dioxygenase